MITTEYIIKLDDIDKEKLLQYLSSIAFVRRLDDVMLLPKNILRFKVDYCEKRSIDSINKNYDIIPINADEEENRIKNLIPKQCEIKQYDAKISFAGMDLGNMTNIIMCDANFNKDVCPLSKELSENCPMNPINRE